MRKYLVVYSTIDKSTEITDIADHYEVFENMKDAKEEYKKILDYDDKEVIGIRFESRNKNMIRADRVFFN